MDGHQSLASPVTGKAAPQTGLGEDSPAAPKGLALFRGKGRDRPVTASDKPHDGMYKEPIPISFLA